MSKLPAFQFYPGDWRKDAGVQALSYHDRGIWFEILCLMHESEQRGKLLLNGKPVPNEALARLLGLDKQILTKTLSTLLEYGVCTRDPATNALMNRRMVRDEELRKIRQESGKKGGNPTLTKHNNINELQILDNQNPTTHLKQNPTPSSSSSSSSSINKKNIYTRKTFKIPALEDVEQYCKQRNNAVNPKKWMDHYTANGWMVGKNKMVDWKAAIRTWEQDENNNGNGYGNRRPEEPDMIDRALRGEI